MTGKISPSMMCTDLMNVRQDVKILEEAGADYLHVDIMDNHFVPNITLSPDFVKALKQITDLPLDIHLMVENPETILPALSECGAKDIISVHYESTAHIQRALAKIREKGAKPGVALNPGTPVGVLEDLLDDADVVLIMTVNPGFAGQKLVPAMLGKIRRLRGILDRSDRSRIAVEVDGNVSFENAAKMHACGADIYVGGSSSVFCPAHSIAENCRRLRAVI